MKNLVAVLALVLSAAVLAGVVGAEPTTRPTTGPSNGPVNKFCPVNPVHEIDPAVTWRYRDMLIGFCCDDCVQKFRKDPEKYLPLMK